MDAVLAVDLFEQILGDDEPLVVLLGEPFQTGGEVHHVADDRVVHLLLGADVAHGHLAEVDPDADVELRRSRCFLRFR